MGRGRDETTIAIDGSFGEGGGQRVRTSVSLAAMTGRTIEVANIRAGRSKPGLQAQHVTAVRAAAALCGAEVRGDSLGSLFVRFEPGPWAEQHSLQFDVAAARSGASAGATGLVAETLLVPLAMNSLAPTSTVILGGTHVPMAPPAEYIEAVYAPMLGRLGLDICCTAARAGFYPKGGGEIRLETSPGAGIRPLECVERGRLQGLRLFIVTSQLPSHVAARGRETVLKEIKGYGVPIDTQIRELPSNGPGAAVVLTAECAHGRGGWTALGERGKPMERVALDAVRGFQSWFATGAAVDEHLADQLALPCALAPGESRWTAPAATEHLRTVLWVAARFLPISSQIDVRDDGSAQVRVWPE